MERTSIKFTNAALDEEGHEIVLRGVPDPANLQHLLIADYQREVLTGKRINSLMNALQSGGVPDIQLGCRGGNYLQRENGMFYVQDDTYIIDGLQRVTAAKRLLAKGIVPHLGAMLYFNTNEDMERKRFKALNITRVKLSPNVLLRNARHESESITALYQLCHSSNFAIYKRVSWSQYMKRDDLITANTLLRTVAVLHRHLGSSLNQRSHERMVYGLDKLLQQRLPRMTLMNNMREFWNLMQESFHVREVQYRDAQPCLKGGFLVSLAQVFNSHEDFWNDVEFRVPVELRKKLEKFPLNDPQIAALCSGSGGIGTTILANFITAHLNSGKRTKRLKPFEIPEPVEDDGDQDNGHSEAA